MNDERGPAFVAAGAGSGLESRADRDGSPHADDTSPAAGIGAVQVVDELGAEDVRATDKIALAGGGISKGCEAAEVPGGVLPPGEGRNMHHPVAWT